MYFGQQGPTAHKYLRETAELASQQGGVWSFEVSWCGGYGEETLILRVIYGELRLRMENESQLSSVITGEKDY